MNKNMFMKINNLFKIFSKKYKQERMRREIDYLIWEIWKLKKQTDSIKNKELIEDAVSKLHQLTFNIEIGEI